jgi:hypothetical protein
MIKPYRVYIIYAPVTQPLEYWKNGLKEYWNTGISGKWNIGIDLFFIFTKFSFSEAKKNMCILLVVISKLKTFINLQ